MLVAGSPARSATRCSQARSWSETARRSGERGSGHGAVRRRKQAGEVDLSTWVASVRLPAAVMTASGTAGHGAELGAYFDLSAIGAVVVKSLSADPWPGNPSPRVRSEE